jgi:hypothetical protein
MSIFTAKVYYCSGTTQAQITVTMTTGTCPLTGTIYDDGTAVWETHRQTITFELSEALDFDLQMNFSADWERTVDEEPPTSGTQTWYIVIPAGLTNYTWYNFEGKDFVCKETRTM